MFNDFAAHMDWSIKESVEDANHNPVAVINGDTSNDILHQNVKPGQVVSLSAAGSYDPDGHDSELSYRWWCYKEAGTYAGEIAIPDEHSMSPGELRIPEDADDTEIHIIFELHDNGLDMNNNQSFEMYDYRRVVLSVTR
jgi:hypothetical protein